MDQIEKEQVEEEINTQRPERGLVFRGVQSVVGIAILTATILTLWNPRSFFRTPSIEDLFQSTIQEEEKLTSEDSGEIRIGILAGHYQNSTGHVCADGRTEHDVNYGIAYQLQLQLEGQGYKLDLFPEFDERLFNYSGDMVIAIYSGSCEEKPASVSGFRIGTSLSSDNLEKVNALTVCLAEKYQEKTQLDFSYDVIGPEHPSYHFFRDISPQIPVVRFEIGSLSTDGDLIFNDSGTIIQALSDGINCYVDQLPTGSSK